MVKRIAEAWARHSTEVQKLQAEKNGLAARLKGLGENPSASLGNARQEERLAAGKESQKQIAVLTKRIAEPEASQRLAEEQKEVETAKIKAELESALNAEKAKASYLGRLTKDHLREIASLCELNQKLQVEMAKAALIKRQEEMGFAEEARSWPGVWIGEKLSRNVNYLMAFNNAAGNALDPVIFVDNKGKTTVTESDIRKLVRDTRKRRLPVAALVAWDQSQLRHADRRRRWAQEDGVWLLWTSRAWLPRDLEVLHPVFERMSCYINNIACQTRVLVSEWVHASHSCSHS